VYSGKDKTIGYSNVIPKEIPLKSHDDIKFLKKTALID
jgi:hypothetical protein